MFNLLSKYTVQKKSKIRGTLIGTAVVSGLIAAGTVFLTSKKTGKENREILIQKSKNLAELAKVKLDTLEEKAKNLNKNIANELQREIEIISQTGKELLQKAKSQMTEVKDIIENKFEQMKTTDSTVDVEVLDEAEENIEKIVQEKVSKVKKN
jgi:gas vesicle protein